MRGLSVIVKKFLALKMNVYIFPSRTNTLTISPIFIPWCDDPLNGWIVRQIEEQAHILHTSILLKILLEESAIIGEENEHKLSTPTLQSPC